MDLSELTKPRRSRAASAAAGAALGALTGFIVGADTVVWNWKWILGGAIVGSVCGFVIGPVFVWVTMFLYNPHAPGEFAEEFHEPTRSFVRSRPFQAVTLGFLLAGFFLYRGVNAIITHHTFYRAAELSGTEAVAAGWLFIFVGLWFHSLFGWKNSRIEVIHITGAIASLISGAAAVIALGVLIWVML